VADLSLTTNVGAEATPGEPDGEKATTTEAVALAPGPVGVAEARKDTTPKVVTTPSAP
jgi:hypothetical protein